jgi:glycosyltransferase involved in cell wall biosynthesis
MMAFGVPVVSYNGEYTKYHAKPFDLHSIAEQIERCWKDLTAEGSTLREDTMKYAREEFHREKHIPKYVELYTELLGKK